MKKQKNKKEKEQKMKNVKATTLVSVVVHGANQFGKLLTKTLLDQGSKVIIIDYFTKETKPFVQELKKNKNVDFIAFEGIENLFNTLERFDYLYYLQFTMFQREDNFTSKDFLEESAHLDKCIKAAIKNKVKMSIVTSLEKNKNLVELTQLEDGKPKPYSDLEIQRYSETITAEQYDKADLNVRIIRLGALLGSEFHGLGDNTVVELFENSISKESLLIKGEGLENHYYINTEDAIFAILRLTFDNQTNGEVISLANDKPLTTLSMAYKLLELNTEARRIEFENNDQEVLYKGHYIPAPFASKYGIKPKFTIEETFVSALDSLYKKSSKKWTITKDNLLNVRFGKKKKNEKSSVLSVKTPFGNMMDKVLAPFKNLFKKKDGEETLFTLKTLAIFLSILTVLLVLSYALITPLANIGYGAYMIDKTIDSAYGNAIEFNLDAASKDFKSLDPHIERVQFGMDRLSWLFSVIGQKDLYDNTLQLLSAFEYATVGAEQMSYSLQPLAEYFQEFEPAIGLGDDTPETTREYREYLEELRARRFQLTKATDNLYLASLKIDSIDTSAFPARIEPYVTTLKQNNDQLLEKIKPFQETVLFLPEMLGVDERQRYLILFQNPAEIRSTGGWISSYALVGIEGGQLRQLDVDDVYNIDGRLKIQGKVVSPPEEMQKALDFKVWTMSTSNWNPDFSESSKDSVYFIKEAGRASEIDGVIAVDTEFLKSILDVWESVTIDGEEEPVTSETLQDKMFEIHDDFTPGSQRKSEFISAVFNELLTKSLQDKAKYPQLLTAIYESLTQKHFLISFQDSDANKFFSTQGWDGSITEDHRSAPVPVEWNWGANKANIYLEETTSLKVKILDENTIQYTFTLSTKNNSTTDTYPEGDYVNYLRVLLPETAIIDEIKGLSGDMNTYMKNNSKVIGGWFNTAASGTNQFVLKYTVNSQSPDFALSKESAEFVLDLNIFKQPGLYPGTYKLEILYPEDWAITADNDFNRDISKVSAQFEQEEDVEYQFRWKYKDGTEEEAVEDAETEDMTEEEDTSEDS